MGVQQAVAVAVAVVDNLPSALHSGQWAPSNQGLGGANAGLSAARHASPRGSRLLVITHCRSCTDLEDVDIDEARSRRFATRVQTCEGDELHMREPRLRRRPRPPDQRWRSTVPDNEGYLRSCQIRYLVRGAVSFLPPLQRNMPTGGGWPSPWIIRQPVAGKSGDVAWQFGSQRSRLYVLFGSHALTRTCWSRTGVQNSVQGGHPASSTAHRPCHPTSTACVLRPGRHARAHWLFGRDV